MKAKAFLKAAGCSLISFALAFYIIPVYFARGTENVLWMSLMAVLPALLAVVMLEGLRPLWVFLNFPIHYGLLAALAAPLSRVWGVDLSGALGWPSYVGTVFTWPLVVTTVQFLILRFQKKRR